jgi:type IV secretory pathway TrbL component
MDRTVYYVIRAQLSICYECINIFEDMTGCSVSTTALVCVKLVLAAVWYSYSFTDNQENFFSFLSCSFFLFCADFFLYKSESSISV